MYHHRYSYYYGLNLYCELMKLLDSCMDTQCPSHVLVSEVITHVKQLQERVETLKQRKQILEATEETAGSSGSSSPVITVKDLGFILEACVICGLKKKLMLHQVINVLVEEAAEVIAVSHSTVGGRIFYTIYFQVKHCYSRYLIS